MALCMLPDFQTPQADAEVMISVFLLQESLKTVALRANHSVPTPLFNAGGHLAQHSNCLLWVRSRSALSREHERIRALPHHIGDVCHLNPSYPHRHS